MRNLKLYFKDIYDAISELEEFTKDLTKKDFVNNRVCVLSNSHKYR